MLKVELPQIKDQATREELDEMVKHERSAAGR